MRLDVNFVTTLRGGMEPAICSPDTGLRVSRRLFQSAEEMARALHGIDIEINVLRDGYFPYVLLSASLGECTLDIAEIGAAVTGAGRVHAGSTYLLAPMRVDRSWYVNGVACEPGRLAVLRSGAELYAYTGGPVQWAALQVPEQTWTQMAGRIGAPAAGQRMEMLALSPEQRHFLRRALGYAQILLREHPALADTPQIRDSLHHSLMDAFMQVVLEGGGAGDPTPGFARAPIVTVVEDYMHAHPDMLLLHINDLCVAAGVSERTLRNAFHEAFGMAPMRYLRIRRLNQVRQLLLEDGAGVASVTDAATRYAFFDLGRFAADYRTLFGEYPSDTWARGRAPRTAC